MAYVRNPLAGWLLKHSYGQGGGVAIPSVEGDPFSLPQGRFPAGVGEVLDRLRQRYSGWSSNSEEIDWCFLIGGPGNGKSEALKKLATMLAIHLPSRTSGDPVPRTIPREWPKGVELLPTGLGLAFVNDASIPRDDPLGPGAPGSLFQDLSDGLGLLMNDVPFALFVNVNRGILVEEAGALAGSHSCLASESGIRARDMIRWLANPPNSGVPALAGEVETLVAIDPNMPFYGQFRLTIQKANSQWLLVVHAVFLDVLSLLEPTPGGDKCVDFSTAVPVVRPYKTIGRLIATDVTRGNTTAGEVVASVASAGLWQDGGCKESGTGELCAAYKRCPFAQNARWLQEDGLRNRFLDALRAAEVAAGRRFTYRDLLGHVALGFLGPSEDTWLTGTHPCDWSAQQSNLIDNHKNQAAISVAAHRIYMGLFDTKYGGRSPLTSEAALGEDSAYGAIKQVYSAAGESPRLQTFERAFRDIDPATDTGEWNGFRARVLDAVEALDVESPSEQVAQWSEAPSGAGSQIELNLDQVIRDEITTELERGNRASVNRVRALRRWRSVLLLRQIGLALGHFGFADAIQGWLAEQEAALRNDPPLKLGEGIRNLIISTGSERRVFFAPLRPRTYCLSTDLPETELLISLPTSELDIMIAPRGDTLTAEVRARRTRQRQPDQVLATLVIDLPIAREAILHASGNMQSFTEIGDAAFARIERARASLIGRERTRRTPALFTDKLKQVYEIVGDSAGRVPLNVRRQQR